MKRFYLVRHAQTTWNGQNRIQGHSDVPLSPLGERQASCLKEFFASTRLSGLITSQMARTRQTAEAILSGLPAAPKTGGQGAAQAGNGHRLNLVVMPDLAEMHLGAWEGLTPSEVDAKFGGAYAQWRVRPSSVIIPDAEPVQDFRRRVRRALEQIVDDSRAGEHVIVTHGGVIAALLADLLDADYDRLLRRLRLDNAGVTALEFETPNPHALWINSTGHLSVLGPIDGGHWG